VVQIVISQLCVWGAILTGRLRLYFYEELGWFVIFMLSSIASADLLITVPELGDGRTLLLLNLLFAAIYLPWQLVNLRALRARARSSQDRAPSGVRRALFEYRRATDAGSWGGFLGLTWMLAYWATLVPLWLSRVVDLIRPH